MQPPDSRSPNNPPRQAVWLARAALCLTTLLWSGNVVAGRALHGAIDPVTLNTLRWVVALAVFLPFAGRGFWAHRAALWQVRGALVVLALTGVVLFHVCVYSAVGQVPVANATLMIATTPFFILAGTAALGQARLTLRDGAALVLSLLGVAVLLGDGQGAPTAGLHLAAGDLWMLAAVLAWAVYTLVLKSLPATLPRDAVLGATMLLGVAMMLPLWLVFGTTGPAALSPTVWAGVAYVAIGASLIAYSLWSFGVDRLGPGAAGFYLNLMPVFGAGLAFLLLGEPLVPVQLLGAAAILGAIALRR